MSSGYQRWERRRAVRHPTPGKIWWRHENDDRTSPAWLSDESSSGMAFVTPGADDLQDGERICVSRTAPRQPGREYDALRICRVEPYGPNLRLVACTRFL